MFSKLLKIVILLFVLDNCASDSDCGDWTSYKDEKCFKVFDSESTELEAEGGCGRLGSGSVLARIKTAEEQELIHKYLKATNIANNVWIGIKKTENTFKWLDETDVKYTNWAKDRPINNSNDYNCVEISLDPTLFGKWMDSKCSKKNAVLCQKIQPWSFTRLQTILLETRERINGKDKFTEK